MAASASAALPATFTSAEARDLGLTRRQLRSLLERGDIERIARGVYRRADAELADFDLIEIVVKAPRATLCLTSALAEHGLTDTNPHEIDVALPRGTWQPVTGAPVRWHQFAADTFDVGRGSLRVDADHEIGLYDAARSIVDAFRLRHAIGEDVAFEALRRWLRGGGRPAELLRVANQLSGAQPALLRALQVLG
ncbi:type IV toxin-antitoxin system AbiEi family antitoxin domain-containing protein [Jiangella rhizosphaerae]|uniref:AbiEi antitoxin N-terminal domain-containing protein n=1 Tax=Jiangella rhizosphaerae TaxID=2293569 RepID=A0A418KIS6_9ACTN|nr:type IV toxin-antitoxin system AbiEi family antitoxin domain-containing protein [Jiangella rhizosphaerae]RIQ13238.1 hypothetical protein DY240_26170 [Jiangella rhizosphaerae]